MNVRILAILAVFAIVGAATAQDRCLTESTTVESRLEIQSFRPDGGCTLIGCASSNGIEECSTIVNHAVCRNAAARDLALKLGKRGLKLGDGGL
jgi:hypothetical protein